MRYKVWAWNENAIKDYEDNCKKDLYDAIHEHYQNVCDYGVFLSESDDINEALDRACIQFGFGAVWDTIDKRWIYQI